MHGLETIHKLNNIPSINAQAAAPDMLKALQKVRKSSVWVRLPIALMVEIEEAIEKATTLL